MKLGKHPATYSRRDLRLSKYLTADKLPVIPAEFGHEAIVTDWRMLGNDAVGDCVWAGACHEHMLWTALGSTQSVFDDAGALRAYSAVTGFNPDDPLTDSGTPVRDAMKYRANVGVLDVSGRPHRIAAYATIEPGDMDRLKAAAYLFSAVGVGILFPESAMDQFENGQPWDVVSNEQPDSGHYIPVVGFRGGNFLCVTWGKLQQITSAFLKKYCDEVWSVFTHEYIRNGTSSEGFDLSALLDDQKAVIIT